MLYIFLYFSVFELCNEYRVTFFIVIISFLKCNYQIIPHRLLYNFFIIDFLLETEPQFCLIFFSYEFMLTRRKLVFRGDLSLLVNIIDIARVSLTVTCTISWTDSWHRKGFNELWLLLELWLLQWIIDSFIAF